MAGNYKNFLKLLESWPLDKSKTGRDLAQHIRDQIKIAYSKGEIQQSQVNQEQCDRYYHSLRRLASNQYAQLYVRASTATASGLSTEQCNLALTPELQEYFLEEDKSRFEKIFAKFKKNDTASSKSS
ncbi:ubiquinol-cytochrome c reductase complex assembly factor 2 [Diachasmimorpha longicaudata]|uniref:ubiquinol-cytochrome c reductase complex assembly factor 2 n=1 Tax=Diachasmimorpha longicaudata TaxID=58733 RepID=UPI0030B8ADBD